MGNWKSSIFTIIIFVCLTFGSLQFVTWICQMAFENTCIELQEQYISTEVKEVIQTIENSVDFGKELDNYYGMQELLQKICHISEGNLKVAVLNAKEEPLYLSFEKSDENIQALARICSEEYREDIEGIKKEVSTVDFGTDKSLVYPIYKNNTEFIGHLLIVYKAKSLITNSNIVDTQNVMYLVGGIASLVLVVFYSLRQQRNSQKKYVRYIPVIIVMTSMLGYLSFMYPTYKGNYNIMISENAKSAATYLQSNINELLKKGLSIEQIDKIGDYLNEKAESTEAIDNISVVKNYYDTASYLGRKGDGILYLDLADGEAQLLTTVSQKYIDEKINRMTLTFGAIFVICLMITYELTNLAEIISVRTSKNFNKKNKQQFLGISAQIKFMSFIAYTAIYTSLPYATVIMRKWDVSVWGLSKSVSASIPLTVELLCIMVFSAIIQKLFKGTKLNRFAFFVFPFLILGNLACTTVTSPYVLIGLRAFCGIGFAFLKYWLNSIVAAGSEDAKAIGKNYANLNAGLLGGITVGASLGAILAEALGYQSNYYFTVVILFVIIVWALLATPWKLLNEIRAGAVEKAGHETIKISKVLKNPSVLRVLVLGAIPLNIGLMYVVAFLPSYMENMGKSSIFISYAYLINGLAGVYLGSVMITMLKKISPRYASAVSLLLAAAGMLVLIMNTGLGVILLSAGVMGLFDGYGTPVITSYFTSLPSVKGVDTASMLTVFNIVGSAVQILCPMLYNVLIQPDGKTTYLMIFGLCYGAVAFLFFVFCKDNKKEKSQK